MRNSKLIKCPAGVLHHIPVTVTAHDDTNPDSAYIVFIAHSLLPVLQERDELCRFSEDVASRVLACVEFSDCKRQYFQHIAVNIFLTLVSKIINKHNLSDQETCNVVFCSNIFQNALIAEYRFGFEPEITTKIAVYKLQYCVYEVGISFY